MALVRCQKHGKPRGRKWVYVRSVKPAGYPNTAAICGLQGCSNPGFIWLTSEESRAYEQGERVFGFNSMAMKVRAE